jgi:hypothetical protein
MVQQQSFHSRWRPFGILATASATLMLGTAADCLDTITDQNNPECTARCDVEAECGFRTTDACEAASCDPISGEVLFADVDACLAAASDCLEAAACACSDGCAKTAECLQSEDADCVDTCDTLVEQQSSATYLENRCKIESSCDEQAACGAVSG